IVCLDKLFPAGYFSVQFKVNSLPAGAACLGSVNLKGRSCLTLKDFSSDEIKKLLWVSRDLKHRIKHEKQHLPLLQGKSIAMIFEKRSTRTRMSTETGVNDSHPCWFGSQNLLHGLNTFDTKHKTTDKKLYNFKPNNCFNLWIIHMNYIKYYYQIFMTTVMKLGIFLSLIKNVQHGTQFILTSDPMEAARDSNVLVTDTWAGLGEEEEKKKRLKDFHGFQVSMQTGSVAKSDWTFLHCLPREMEEVDDQVFYSSRSLVFSEAENRKWTIMGLIVSLLTDYTPQIPMLKF
uniref:ornithine carbamoyltransferase n=1 Tax=Neolamprologus brichardi TaxID=32507 RepID=A0A3Q4MCW2_NEOBR